MDFKETKIIKTSMVGPFKDHIWKYRLILPDFLADWDVWDYWEQERIFSIEKHLKRGDIFFDIGAEHGELPALFAKYVVGGENMVLFEPSEYFWPNIKAIWKANQLDSPKATFCGFVGDFDSLRGGRIEFKEFPSSAKGELTNARPYRYLHNPSDKILISSITIDTFVEVSKIKPKALNIDIEGAEFLALKGARTTLKKIKPLVWVSIHPDLLKRDYGANKEEIFEYMKKLGYKYELLAIDHEEHYFFSPNKYNG